MIPAALKASNAETKEKIIKIIKQNLFYAFNLTNLFRKAANGRFGKCALLP